MHKALHCEAAHPRLHGKHSRCVWAPVVYREAPTVFITLGFLRVASVNKQVLVDSQLILHWNSHSLCVCRRRDTFFFLSPCLLFLHMYFISIMLQWISCVFLRCTTPRATTSSDKELPETLFILLAKARWRFSHIIGARYQRWFRNEVLIEWTDSFLHCFYSFCLFLSNGPFARLKWWRKRPGRRRRESCLGSRRDSGLGRKRCGGKEENRFHRKWCRGHGWRMNDVIFLRCCCLYDVITLDLFREDIRTASVIAAGEVTCLVIDRE